MPEPRTDLLPVACRAIIAAASWLVPRASRVEWLRKWRGGALHWWAFLVERDELTRTAYAQLLTHCWTAFVDAFWLRFPHERLRGFLRGPAFVFITAGLFFCLLAAASRGFQNIRYLYGPVPYANPDRLVALSQQRFSTPFAPLPPLQIKHFGTESKTLAGIAAYHVDWQHGHLGRATWNLFSLIGIHTRLGRTFQPDDQDAAVVSYDTWRWSLGSDPGAIGRTLLFGGRQLRVVGVLPENVPGLTGAVPVWTHFTLPDREWPLMETVARLRPGVTMQAAQKELNALAAAEPKLLIRDARVYPLPANQDVPRGLFLGLAGFGVAIGIILLAIGRQSPIAGRVNWKQATRSWAFLLLKTALVEVSLLALWMETSGVRVRMRPGELREFVWLVARLLPTWGFVVASAVAVLWCVADQKRRCPVCLNRLAMPVRIGSWSSPLLDPVSTELLCEKGHGSLSMPEALTSAAERDRWTAMDESWKDLFTR